MQEIRKKSALSANRQRVISASIVISLAGLLALTAVLYYPVLNYESIWRDLLSIDSAGFAGNTGFDPIGAREILMQRSNHFEKVPTALLIFANKLLPNTPQLFHALPLTGHLLNTLFVFILASTIAAQFGLRRWSAFYAASLFALHPAAIESTAHVRCLPQVLGASFTLLAIIAERKLTRSLRVPLILSLFTLGALSDPAALGLPVIMVFWLGAFNGGVSGGVRQNKNVLLPLFGLSLAGLSFLFASHSLTSLGLFTASGSISLGRSLLEYLSLLVWPFSNVRPIHYWPAGIKGNSLEGLLSLLSLAWAAGLFVLATTRPKNHLLLFASSLSALVVMILITSNFLPAGASAMERFVLIPLALLCVASSFLINGILSAPTGFSRLAFTPLLAWLCASTLIIIIALPRWANESSLHDWAITKAPESELAQSFFVEDLYRSGAFDTALRAADEFLTDHPEYPDVWRIKGMAHISLGKAGEALKSFEQALSLEPESAARLADLAGAHLANGDYEGAKSFALKAVEIQPRSFTGHYQLGMILRAQGHLEEAKQELTRAMELGTDDDKKRIEQILAEL